MNKYVAITQENERALEPDWYTDDMLGNIGPMELIIVLVIALVILGPKRLPEVGRSLGRGMREFKESVTSHGHDEDDEPDEYDALVEHTQMRTEQIEPSSLERSKVEVEH